MKPAHRVFTPEQYALKLVSQGGLHRALMTAQAREQKAKTTKAARFFNDVYTALLRHSLESIVMHICELSTRQYRGRKSPRITGPEDVVTLVGKKLQKEQREHFVALLLNARHEVARVETISIGSLNASIVHPREVFKPAILHSAASIILVHNHPSGDPEPSEDDISITKRLVSAGELVGIGVLDHVIIGKSGHVSFKNRQLLGGTT